MQHILLFGVYYPIAHLVFVVCINIVGALQEYENDNDFKMIIMVIKLKSTNYFPIILSIYLVTCVFYHRITLDSLGNYLSIYF